MAITLGICLNCGARDVTASHACKALDPTGPAPAAENSEDSGLARPVLAQLRATEARVEELRKALGEATRQGDRDHADLLAVAVEAAEVLGRKGPRDGETLGAYALACVAELAFHLSREAKAWQVAARLGEEVDRLTRERDEAQRLLLQQLEDVERRGNG
jgi:hypothetical protein